MPARGMNQREREAAVLRRQNLVEFAEDIGEGVLGIPEAALSMGTAMVSQAGTGLGTLAGITADALRGRKPDWDAAADTIEEGTQNFAYAPRSEGGERVLEGAGQIMEPVDKAMQGAGQVAADVTGSPAVGAGVYTVLNIADPGKLVPGAATIAALRDVSQRARAAKFLPVKQRGIGGSQSGAWAPGDIADVEGDFDFRSPTVDAFDNMKPQQKKQAQMKGRELRKVLTDAGASKEEMEAMGLDVVLDTDDVVNVAEVRDIAQTNRPAMQFKQARAGEGGELDEDELWNKAREEAENAGELNYPIAVYEGSGRDRTHVESFDTQEEADAWIAKRREEMQEEDFEYFNSPEQMRDNLGEEEFNWHMREGRADKAEEIARQLNENVSDDQLDMFGKRYVDPQAILDNIEQHVTPQQLEKIDEKTVEEWARGFADKSDFSDSDLGYSTETDYEGEFVNEQSVINEWMDRIRENPGEYDMATGGDPPAYGDYTVGSHGEKPEANYTVASGNLVNYPRFGRGGFVGNENIPRQVSGVKLPGESTAYQREALRRQQLMGPDARDEFLRDDSTSHYSELGRNQMFFSRETDRAAPAWGSVQEGVGPVAELQDYNDNPMKAPQKTSPLRMLEEAQSDWYQKARKSGWADPKGVAKAAGEDADEAARVNSFKQQAISELPTALARPEIVAVINAVESGPETPANQATRESLAHWREIQAARERGDAVNINDQIEAGQRLANNLYGVSTDNVADSLLNQLRQGFAHLRSMETAPGGNLTPTGPLRETPQYTQLAAADALRRTVMEGQQYFAWTPGDVHSRRWGSETVQFAPSPDNPRVIFYRHGKPGNTGQTYMEGLQEQADALLGEGGDTYKRVNLDDPNSQKQLEEMARDQLNYGMQHYRNPDAALRKRAALVRKQMEELSAEAQAGNRRASHYSPRAVGNEQSYGPMEKHIIDILRRAGVKQMPEIRDIPLAGSPVPMRGFEIDPEIARAAKRGFVLPYFAR